MTEPRDRGPQEWRVESGRSARSGYPASDSARGSSSSSSKKKKRKKKSYGQPVAIGVLVVALLTLGFSYYFFFGERSGGWKPTTAYFVDEETGEESVRPINDIPPLPGKSGKPTVVREFKYSDDGGRTVKVAYYFKYTEDMKKRLEETVAAGKSQDQVDAAEGELVRAPATGSRWVSLRSGQGRAVAHIDIQGKESSFKTINP